MTKPSKTTKRTKHQPKSGAKTKATRTPRKAQVAPTPPSEATDDSPLAQAATAPTTPAKSPQKPRRTKSPKTEKKPRTERVPLVNLDPAEEIKPVRAGTHLADVLALTARPEGATAVELDKAIVTTAKSVRHYGVWALRYALHKQKGFGFRTIELDDEPARYVLVLPKGREFDEFIAARSGTAKTSKRAATKQG